MRKRVFGFSALALLAVLVLWWWRREAFRRPDGAGGRGVAAAEPGAGRRTEPASQPRADPRLPTEQQADAAWAARWKRDVAAAEAEEARVDRPMEFWGKVIDEADMPVAGVEVAYGATSYVPGTYGKMYYHKGSTRADTAGRFHIGPVRGRDLKIERLEKHGYWPVGQPDQTFMYALEPTQVGPLFSPNPDTPVVFRMARLHGGVALADFGFRASVPLDGTPVQSSTANGMLDGTFEIRFSGTAPAADQPYDWTATVSLTGGAVQAAVDDYLYTAPADGYVPAIQITMKKENAGWKHDATVALFARTGTGRYGRFVIYVAAPYVPDQSAARIVMTGAINAYGGRNLEQRDTAPTR